MSKKITKMPTPTNSATVVCDEVLTRKDGQSLRMRVDLATILNDIQLRHQALLIARHIPLDRVNISPTDQVVTSYRQQLPKDISDNDIMDMARGHYEQFVADAYEDALVLAMFAHPDNSHLPNPEPYSGDEVEQADDLINVPTPKKNILHPSERKLKQILDFVASDLEILGRFRQIFNSVTLKINALATEGAAAPTTDAGFQSGGTDRDLSELTVAPSLQPAPST